MPTNIFRFPPVVALLAGLGLSLVAALGQAATVEEETANWIAVIRGIKAEGDHEATDRYNKQLDAAWKFFGANKSRALPILRETLAEELKREAPDQLVLLDLGYFVRLQAGESDKILGRNAFFAIDPNAEIVHWNRQQLFEFAHAVAPDRDPRTLAFLDRAFLRGGVRAFIPQHSLSLDETLVCVFLYGVFGEGAEKHLATQIADRAIANRIIEILGWIGSPESVAAVDNAMKAARDHDALVRGTAFMMMAGGPNGRGAMLALPIATFDDKSQQYYAKIRRDIEAVSYPALAAQFKGFPDGSPMTDADLRKALAAMYRNFGKDDTSSPKAILKSGLPKSELIAELTRIRARMLFRLSDEALGDVKITNALLNALYFKAR